jgi:hypothetical protein
MSKSTRLNAWPSILRVGNNYNAIHTMIRQRRESLRFVETNSSSKDSRYLSSIWFAMSLTIPSTILGWPGIAAFLCSDIPFTPKPLSHASRAQGEFRRLPASTDANPRTATSISHYPARAALPTLLQHCDDWCAIYRTITAHHGPRRRLL